MFSSKDPICVRSNTILFICRSFSSGGKTLPRVLGRFRSMDDFDHYVCPPIDSSDRLRIHLRHRPSPPPPSPRRRPRFSVFAIGLPRSKGQADSDKAHGCRNWPSARTIQRARRPHKARDSGLLQARSSAHGSGGYSYSSASGSAGGGGIQQNCGVF